MLVYRLDRLGRRMRVVLDTHDALEMAGVAIISASEPFDTSTPFGKAMFQFLGLMAELEKSTIADRMNGGRDTVVRVGKWTNGPVPFGYVVGGDGCLAPSEIMVDGTGMTEAQIAHAIFERLANGDTGMGVCRWLNALNVPTGARYANGKVWARKAGQWKVCRIGAMIRRPLYSGHDTFQSRHGPITRDVPALVSPELQSKAIQVMESNAKRPSRESRTYILTGVLRCAQCGLSYVGWVRTSKNKEGVPYYRCGGYPQSRNTDASKACNSKAIPAHELEPAVLAFVRNLYLNPQEMLERAQSELRKRIGQTAGMDARREALTKRMVELDAEREIVLTLCKRGKITMDDAEKSLDETQASVGAVQAELAGLRAQQALAEAAESRLVDAASILQRAGQNFDTLTADQQREAIRRLVPEIVVTTVELPASERKGRRYKDYTLEANVVVGSKEAISNLWQRESDPIPSNGHEPYSKSAIVSTLSMPSRGSAPSPCAARWRPGTASC